MKTAKSLAKQSIFMAVVEYTPGERKTIDLSWERPLSLYRGDRRANHHGESEHINSLRERAFLWIRRQLGWEAFKIELPKQGPMLYEFDEVDRDAG